MTESLSFDRVADVYDETRGGMRRGRRVARDLAPVIEALRRMPDPHRPRHVVRHARITVLQRAEP